MFVPSLDEVLDTATLRQRIVEAIKAILEGIAPGRVHEWRVTPFALAELPALDIRDTVTNREPLSTVEWRHSLRVEIRALSSGFTAVSSARDLATSVPVALKSDETLSGLVHDLEVLPLSEDLEVDQAGKRVAEAGVVVMLHYIGDVNG